MNADPSQPLNLRLIARLFRIAPETKPLQRRLLVHVITRAIQLPLLAWGIGAIINGPITQNDPLALAWSVTAYLLFAIATEVNFRFRMLNAQKFGEAVVYRLRSRVFRHVLDMPMAFFDRVKVGTLISRMTSDIELVRAGVQEVLFVSLVQGGQMLVSGALMAWYEPQLFLIVLGMAPILWFLNRRFHGEQSRMLRHAQESFRNVTAQLAESVSGVRVTQSFVRGEEAAGIFRRMVEHHSQFHLGAARGTAVLFPLLELNSQFFVSALLLVGGWQALQASDPMPLGHLIMFLFLANLFFQPIQSLGTQYNNALSALSGAESVFALLAEPPDWTDDPGSRDVTELRGDLVFENVHFSYSPDRIALADVSFHAPAGSMVALVGHSGSGKTTIARLASKLYLPTSGRILLDGTDLAELRGTSLRRRMAVVTQRSILFAGSIRENLAFGAPEVTDDQILAVLEELGCVDELGPLRLDAPVTEDGSNLSQGQRQLFCIARALLADPRMLILDEATSTVDGESEGRVQQAVARLLRDRTSLVIAHRLSTIRHADLILVLDHGHVVERGTHASLLAEDGAYAALYRKFTHT